MVVVGGGGELVGVGGHGIGLMQCNAMQYFFSLETWHKAIVF